MQAYIPNNLTLLKARSAEGGRRVEEIKPSMLGQLPGLQPGTGKDPLLPVQALYPSGSEHLPCTEGAREAAAGQGKQHPSLSGLRELTAAAGLVGAMHGAGSWGPVIMLPPSCCSMWDESLLAFLIQPLRKGEAKDGAGEAAVPVVTVQSGPTPTAEEPTSTGTPSACPLPGEVTN